MTVKKHSVRLVMSGNGGLFKMLMFCIRTLVFFESWHLSTVIVKGDSGGSVTSGNAGVLYMNTFVL